VLSLANSAEKPSETPLSTCQWKVELFEQRWLRVLRDPLPNTPAAALLSSEALNVVTSAAHSVGAEESACESGAENESERDREEDDDDSDDDLEIVGEQSGTADSTGASSAGTEAPAKKAT
jgi:hypothetical protein